MPELSLSDLVECLALEAIDEERFRLRNLPMDYYRVFGGQLLAQAIVAASRAEAGKRVKSMTVTFPREGRSDAETEIVLRRVHSGRSFATLSCEVLQGERSLMLGTVLLDAPEPGPGHQIAVPDGSSPDAATPTALSMIPWETRIRDGVDLSDPAEAAPELDVWMRAAAAPDDPALQQALLAHATDLTLIGTTLRAHPGVSQADSPERIHTAVVSHSLWFHAPIDLSDWLCLHQHSPISGGGRGFGMGHVVDHRGGIVASFAQESMIRVRDLED